MSSTGTPGRDERRGVADLDQRREYLDVISQKTRFTLLQNIVSHPEQYPSLEELNLLNPSLKRQTIHGHLKKLVEVGAIEKHENPENKRTDGLPTTFYRINPENKHLIEATGLFDAAETLQHYYNAIEKTDEHKKYEQAPRP